MIRIKKFKEAYNLKNKIESLIPRMVSKVQRVYDNWNQDEEDYDEMYGHGGICDDIADAICQVLMNNDIDSFSSYNEYDFHTSAYAYDFSKYDGYEHKEQGIDERIMYKVDIPPYIYETGSGYTWKKIPGVKFDKKDFIVEDYSMFIDNWFEYKNDKWELIEY